MFQLSTLRKSSMVSEAQEPLLNQDQLITDEPLYKGLEEFQQKVQMNQEEEETAIYIDGTVYPPKLATNEINNQKYTMKNFVPKVLYNQFKYFFNLFFLVIALSQFIPFLKVGFLFSYIAPLVFVLLLTMSKEAYDDIKRYKRDQEVNQYQYTVRRREGNLQVCSKDLKVGDLIEINANQRAPADLVIVSTNQPNEGTVFIRTDQLDGETDWKLRRPIQYTHNFDKQGNLFSLRACLNVQKPCLDIYKFDSIFILEQGATEGYKEGISLQNTMWANTYLAAGSLLGIIVYVGKETRSILNQREPRTKMCLVDMELNKLSKICLMIMCGLAALVIFFKGFGYNWLIEYFRFVLLLSSIIPISLRVNLDIAKIIYAYNINNDVDIPGTNTRNSLIPEELGRVQYILCDKTGTLTQNEMVFRKLCLETGSYSDQNVNRITSIIKKQCQITDGPLTDVAQKAASEDKTKKRRIMRREKELVLRDLITALVLCHNVTPIIDDNEKVYQASSPDEIALVKLAEKLKMVLISRDQDKIVIKNSADKTEVYKILAQFPFSSEYKRMGIILEQETTQRIIFYLKGADSVMKNKVPQIQRGFLLDECENLAREGLRTLVITQKYLTRPEFDQWFQKYQEANQLLANREYNVRNCIEQLEENMEFLGITGVEDILQEDICQTLHCLRNGGINIWMITGDKVETATCIAISTGLKAPTDDIFTIKETEDQIQLVQQLNEFSKTRAILVIDGISLTVALQHKEKFFFEIATNAIGVVCCRCTPTQKSIIAEGVKRYTRKITLAIGDGGNDVGMIQTAHIGIGIVGKEGRQAALASDYSIQKFKYLAKLLLFHGRLNYKRTAVMSQFILHRGTIISVMQVIFNCIYYFIALPIFNGYLMLGYTTIYTLLPVLCLILDQDVNYKVALDYPQLYKTLQNGRDLSFKTFLIWVFKSVYQGTIIIVLSFMLFKNSYFNLVTITYSSLIVAEIINVYIELNRPTWKTFALTGGTLIFYVLSIFYMKGVLNMSAIDGGFIANIILITVLTCLPFQGFNLYRKYKNPDDYQTIMKLVKQQEQIDRANQDFDQNQNDAIKNIIR